MGKRNRRSKGTGQGTDGPVKRNMKDPDPNSEEFMHDEVDRFHLNQDKIMLDPSEKNNDESDLEEEMDEEVLPVHGESSESDDGDSEDEAHDESDEENNLTEQKDKAWGRNKRTYYDADVQDDDVYTSDEEAETTAVEEEKEAMMLQKRLAEQLDSEDFYSVVEEKKDTLSHKVSIDKDFTQLTKREKLEILAEEAPELLPLLDEYKEKFAELKEIFHPLMLIAKNNLITNLEGVQYIKIKHQLLMNYLVNISFYFALKLSKENTKGHPVVDVLVQHQQFLSQLKPLDEKLEDEIGEILSKYEDIDFTSLMPSEEKDEEKDDCDTLATNGRTSDLTEFENCMEAKKLDMDPLEYYKLMKIKSEKTKKLAKNPEILEDENMESLDLSEEGKRMITYEMSKNKGLIRNRRKELKNPRVKHKMKFKKAVIKRKGQVKEVQPEINRYAGETTGIKASLSRSTKIK